MEISTSFSAQRHQSESLFSLAMPPLLKSDLSDHSARAFCYPSSVSTFGRGVYPLLRSPTFFTSTPSIGATPSSFGSEFLVPYPSRSQEVSLARRELRLRQEMDHYRVEEIENEKRLQREQERKEEREARERLIASARQIEEDRAKRLDEQQERLLQKERAFEDYKAQKAREVEAAKERRVAAEEKRRELLFQQELERIKVENERRVAEQENEKTQLQILAKQMSELEEELQEKFQKELEEKEQHSREALQQQAQEWEKRLLSLEVHRQTALANLQLQREQDRDQLVHSEREINEAKEEVRQLKNELQMMRKDLVSVCGQGEGDADGNGGGRVWGPSLASQHQRSIHQLQEVFEEDKRRSRRQFSEEVERLKVEMERRMDDLRDQHRTQLRCKEEDLASTQRQLGESQRCLEEEKAKLAMRLHTGDAYFVQEEARLKEEVRTFRFKNQELEESLSKAQRRQNDQERQVDQQSKTIKTLQEEIQHRWKKRVEEMDALREENNRLCYALQTEKKDRQAEKESLQTRLLTAEEHQERLRAMEDLEEKFHGVSTAKESQEKRWEREREELQKKLRIAAEELESCKQREAMLEREATTLKHRSTQSEHQRMGDLECSRRELDDKTMKLEQAESQLRETTTRLDRAKKELQAERIEREQQRATSAQLKNGETQQLLTELDERKREIATLRESNTNLSISQEAESQRYMRVVREKEGEISIRQREVEDLQRRIAVQQRSMDELQRQLNHATSTHQRSLHEKEESLNALQLRLTELAEEKMQTERELRRAEEERQFAHVDANTQQLLLKEKDDHISRLETEGRQMKQQIQTQRSTVEELRGRLVQAKDTIHSLSFGTSQNYRATPVAPSTHFQEQQRIAISANGSDAQERPKELLPSTPSLVLSLPHPLQSSQRTSPSPCYPNGSSSPAAGGAKGSSPNIPSGSAPSYVSGNVSSTGGGVGGSLPCPALSPLANREESTFQDHPPTPSTWVPPMTDLTKSTALVPPLVGSISSLTHPDLHSSSPATAPVPSFLVSTVLTSPPRRPMIRPHSARSTSSSGRGHSSHPPASNANPTIAESEKAPPGSSSLVTPSSKPNWIIPPPPPPAPVFLSPQTAESPPSSSMAFLSEGGKEPPSVVIPSSLITSASPPSERVGPSLHEQVENPIPNHGVTPDKGGIVVPSPVVPSSPFSGFVTKGDQILQSGYSLSSQPLQEIPPTGNSSAASSTFIGAIAPPPPLSLPTNVLPTDGPVIPSVSSLLAAPFSGGPPVVPPPPPVVVPSFVNSVPVPQPSSISPGSLPLKEEKKKHHHHRH